MTEVQKILVERFCNKPAYLDNGAGKLARRWKVSEMEVREAKILARELLRSSRENEQANYIKTLEDQLVKISNEKGTLESTITSDFAPQSDEELARLHKIDLKKYKISNYWSKVKPDGKFTSSVFATLKKKNEFNPEDFAQFLKDYQNKTIPIVYSKRDNSKQTVDVEVSVCDVHINRLTLTPSTLENRVEEYLSVIDNLILAFTGAYNVDTIIFPIGNDFFNSDNYHETTTNGTPQRNSAPYDAAYEAGFDALVAAIIKLKSVCNKLHVILVQGNHDKTTDYYLAHGLEIYFKKYDNISFDREASNLKSVVLGNTFIGYHHGNTKIEELPLIFATSPEYSKSFGLSKYREVHTADKHHYMVKEIKGSGVRIQQIPSLAGPDRWSNDNNYINNIRAGLALVYHPEKGKIAEIEERI